MKFYTRSGTELDCLSHRKTALPKKQSTTQGLYSETSSRKEKKKKLQTADWARKFRAKRRHECLYAPSRIGSPAYSRLPHRRTALHTLGFHPKLSLLNKTKHQKKTLRTRSI